MSVRKKLTEIEAKNIFINAGCSHLCIAAKSPYLADEYLSLNISKELEDKWRDELFNKYFYSILNCSDEILLWNIHRKMTDLLYITKNINELEKLLFVTEFIKDDVPQKDKLFVAETINKNGSRSARKGLIYLSYDLNKKDFAKTFINLSKYYSFFIEGKTRNLDLCNLLLNEIDNISKELDLL